MTVDIQPLQCYNIIKFLGTYKIPKRMYVIMFARRFAAEYYYYYFFKTKR